MTEDDPNTISYLITGLLLCAPLGLGWYLLFRIIKKDIRTILNFSFLILCTIIALMAYCGLCMAVFSKIDGRFGDLTMPVMYTIGMTSSFLLLPSLAITIILFALYWIKRKNKADPRT